MALTERIRRIFSAILSPHFLGREQEALVEMAGASLDEAQDMIDAGIEGVQAQIDDLHSEYGAGLIGIEDQDDNFTSTNVEGALKELAERDISEEDVDVTGNWSFHNPITLIDAPYSGSLGASLTDDRAYTLPDASGTIALLDDIPPQIDLIAGNNVIITGIYPTYTISVPNIPAQINLTAGSNINITGTYPNLTISATGGSGGGDVTSVNGQIGDVVLTAANVGAAPASHTHAAGDITSGTLSDARIPTLAISKVSGLQGALNGKANTSHTHSASDITSGIIARARLGTGTADEDTFLRGDGVWAVPAGGGGGGGGTVTRVQVAASGPGLSFTGGPITTTGTITGTLSTNLQGWSGVAPSSKADTTSVVTTTGNQTGLAGNKTWTGGHTFTGATNADKITVERTGSTARNAYVTYSTSATTIYAGIANVNDTTWGIGTDPNLTSNNTPFQFDTSTGNMSASGSISDSGGNLRTAIDGKADASRTVSAGNGLSGGGSLAANRTISMGTPAAVTLSSTNSVGTSSHTHAFSPGGTTSQYIRGDGTLATFPSIPAGTVTSVSGGNGLTGSVTTSGSISLGTPGTITGSTTNAVQANSHTHALSLVAGDIPNLPASKITSGAFSSDRIPNLNASKITAGTFAAARIPDLSSSYVATSGNQTGIAGNKTFTGNITAANVTATSDVRLKEKVEESRGRQELLEALRHYRWKWKSSGNPGIGVLAQEVQKHAPEYVHEDDEGTLSVDKAGLALEMVFALIDKLEAIDGSSV